MNIETRRFAVINRAEGSIYFQVGGFNTFPLTAEGPFPSWDNDLKLTMMPGQEIPKTGKRKFSVGKDFSVRYDAVKTGTILVDQNKRQIEVQVKYTKHYWWNRVKGWFPITEDK